MTPDITRLIYARRTDPTAKLTSLTGLLSRREGLSASFGSLPKNKAPGVDGLRKDDYSEGLQERLDTLSKALKDLSYTPKPARRVYIPKLDGGRRPLGIPAFEDRIVQDRISQILQAIWEEDFKDCSYGFRPGRGAHNALHDLLGTISTKPTRYVVEADIKGFFNHVRHDWLMKFLSHRIADKRFLQIVHRLLRAGVMEDGVVQISDEGTPQGGLASPVLANIYLHYTLDLWFEHVFRKACKGHASLIRYADDFVVCFERRDDAKAFMHLLPERLSKFGLEVEPSKTKLIRFGRWAAADNKKEGGVKSETFNFLGFTHFGSKSRKGYFKVGVKTEGKRMRKKLLELKERLKQLSRAGSKSMCAYTWQHLRGHINYYGISGNYRSLTAYRHQVESILFKWLNRRSQRKSITREKFRALMQKGLLPKVQIVHNMYDFYGKSACV